MIKKFFFQYNFMKFIYRNKVLGYKEYGLKKYWSVVFKQFIQIWIEAFLRFQKTMNFIRSRTLLSAFLHFDCKIVGTNVGVVLVQADVIVQHKVNNIVSAYDIHFLVVDWPFDICLSFHAELIINQCFKHWLIFQLFQETYHYLMQLFKD